MNAKEMEALIKQQGAMIEALTKRADEQGGVINEQAHELVKYIAHRETLDMKVDMKVEATAESIALLMNLMGYDESDPEGPFFAELKGLQDHVQELDVLVKGRNKSAAVKRNMTDADARCVLTGEHKDLPHKEAAEKIGLTYAQVYSCRMEYTFKHVHHELRKDPEWKSPWKK